MLGKNSTRVAMERLSVVRRQRAVQARRCVLLAVASMCAIRPSAAADDAVADAPRVLITPRKAPNTSPQPAIRVNVKLTLIPVTVTDPFGASFSGLPKEAFRLFEDGVEQQLKYFSS